MANPIARGQRRRGGCRWKWRLAVRATSPWTQTAGQPAPPSPAPCSAPLVQAAPPPLRYPVPRASARTAATAGSAGWAREASTVGGQEGSGGEGRASGDAGGGGGATGTIGALREQRWDLVLRQRQPGRRRDRDRRRGRAAISRRHLSTAIGRLVACPNFPRSKRWSTICAAMPSG